MESEPHGDRFGMVGDRSEPLGERSEPLGERPGTLPAGDLDDAATRVMNVLGERWTFLILRQAFFGVHRFGQMQRNLGISRNTLAARLQKLVELRIMSRRRYRRDPDFYEYHFTERGLELYPAVLALARWGDRYLPVGHGLPITLRHKPCGQPADPRFVCSHCGGEIHARDVEVELGEPGPAG
jgi:DNA-binding HxlR family transcriptional regulator